MKYRFVLFLGVATAAVALLVAGCGQTAGPESKAPTAQPKATQPSGAAQAATPAKAAEAAKPTVEPAKKTDFPAKGRAVSLIVPYPAGGGSDIGARVLAPLWERELGTSVEILNKGGAGSQVGVTELARAKPDGYTIGYPNWPTIITMYLDSDRKAVFGRKDFQTVGLHLFDPIAVAVKAGSPYKSLKDLVDAALANPEKIKVSDTGLLSPDHLTILQLQRLTGAKFANVHFEGGAPAVTALLGGHTDAAFGGLSPFLPQVRNGELRVLATMDREETKFIPGVKTAEAQGFKLNFGLSRGFIAPAGTPKEVVGLLSAAMKRAMDKDEHKKKMDEMGQTPRYLDPDQFAAFWDSLETEVKPLVEQAKKEEAKK